MSESADPFSPPALVDHGRGQLGALMEDQTPFPPGDGVVEGRELFGQKTDQGHRAPPDFRHHPGKTPPPAPGQSAADIAENAEARFQEGDGDVSPEDVGQVGFGELGQISPVVDRVAFLERPGQGCEHAEGPVVRAPPVFDRPFGVPPETEIDAVHDQKVIDAGFVQAAVDDGGVPVRMGNVLGPYPGAEFIENLVVDGDEFKVGDDRPEGADDLLLARKIIHAIPPWNRLLIIG